MNKYCMYIIHIANMNWSTRAHATECCKKFVLPEFVSLYVNIKCKHFSYHCSMRAFLFMCGVLIFLITRKKLKKSSIFFCNIHEPKPFHADFSVFDNPQKTQVHFHIFPATFMLKFLFLIICKNAHKSIFIFFLQRSWAQTVPFWKLNINSPSPLQNSKASRKVLKKE